MGSKETSTTGKKELCNGLKAYHEKKQEDFVGKNTAEHSVVNSTGYATVEDIKGRASVVDELLPSSGSSSLVKGEC